MERPPVIIIINTSPDVGEMLRIAFEFAGILAVTTFSHQIRSGAVDIEAFMRLHKPQVVLYDIAPPYASNWLLFQHVMSLPSFVGKPLVLTTTNKTQVTSLATDSKMRIFEIIGTPYNLNELVDEVRQALHSRPTSEAHDTNER